MKTPEDIRRTNAVAITYIEGETAPRVVAKGQGLVADEIIARAKAAGVYVHESRELVSLLMQVDLDERIPPKLYIAIAELLAWIYALEQGSNVPNTPPVLPDDIVAAAKQQG